MKARNHSNVVKAFAAASAIALLSAAWGAEWNDGKYTWSYEENGDGTVKLYKSHAEPAISPKPTGALVIPSMIDGKPLKEIADYAFYECDELVSVTISEGVTRIGEYAFAYCDALVSVTISEGVTVIDMWAFRNCGSLERVEMPATLTEIVNPVFYGCKALQEFSVAAGNAHYKSVNGLLLSKDGKTLIQGVGGNVTIPDGVTTIGDEAFFNCGLTEVVFPDSVTAIGNYAFLGCNDLTSVVIPSGVTAIGDAAFQDCQVLDYVTIPDSVTTIGDDAFANCDVNYAVVPEAFSYSSDKSRIFGKTSPNIIADNVKVEVVDGIGWTYAVDDDGNASVGNGAGDYAIHPTTAGAVTIPSTLGGYPVTAVKNNAFYECDELVSVTIPPGVTSIGDWAFYSCDKLYNVTIQDGMTTIGGHAFEECENLKSVIIPGSVTSIGEEAFRDCTSLATALVPEMYDGHADIPTIFNNCPASDDDEIFYRDVNVAIEDGFTWVYTLDGDDAVLGGGIDGLAIPPDTTGGLVIPASVGGHPVTAIGEDAFADCAGLTSVTIPDSVTDFDSSAFNGCSALQEFFVTEGNTHYKSVNGLLLSNDGKTLVRGVGGNVTIPDGVTEINRYAFYDCAGLLEMVLPDSVKVIGEYAFAHTGISTVTIPAGVTAINRGAFLGCASLEDAVIPSGMKKILDRAFANCGALASVTIPDSVTDISDFAFQSCANLNNAVLPKSFDGDSSVDDIFDSSPTAVEYRDVKVAVVDGVTWVYTVSDDGEATVGGGVDSLAVPPTTTGDLAIPASLGGYPVTAIGEKAFHDIDGLVNVEVPASVTSIGDSAFDGCFSLLHVTLPGYFKDKELSSAFSGCPIYPDGIEFLTADIVDGIVWTYTVVDGEAVLGDGEGGLAIPQDTTGNLSIPSTLGGYTVTGIGDSAFSECEYVTGIKIPSTVKSIGHYAFYGCAGLTKVLIPDSVTSLGESVFAGCTGLTRVNIGDGLSNLADNMFAGCEKLQKVSIPENVKSIGNYAFDDCVGLTSVKFPNGLTRIGEYAFLDCSELKAVMLKSDVVDIADNAFLGCSNLKSAIIPKAFERVDLSNAFEVTTRIECRDVKTETVDELEWVYTIEFGAAAAGGGFGGRAVDTDTAGALVIPKEFGGYLVTGIADGAFSGCVDLTSVTIPDAVTAIGKHAFRNCTSLKELLLPANVASVGDDSFDGCVGLKVKALFVLKDTFNVPDGCTIEYYGEPDEGGDEPGTGGGEEEPGTGGGDEPGTGGGDEPGTGGGDEQPGTGGGNDEASIGGGEQQPGDTGGGNESGTGGGVSDGSEGGSSVAPDAPCYAVLNAVDITEPYAAPKAVTLHGAVFDGCDVVGIVELKLGKVNAKKKSSKVSGSFVGLDCKRSKINAVKLSGIDGTAPVSVSLTVKNYGTMEVTIGGDRFAGSLGGWHVQSADVGGAWTKPSAAVAVAANDVSMFHGMVIESVLPYDETASTKNGKWAFAKAAGVKWTRVKYGATPVVFDAEADKGLVVDDSKGKTNLSGLKLNYTPNKGTFKGSFKVYALEGSGKATKLKKYTVKVSGVVVNGVGYGIATSKKPSVSWTVEVK